MAEYAHTDVLYISRITRLLCSELDLLLNILARLWLCCWDNPVSILTKYSFIRTMGLHMKAYFHDKKHTTAVCQFYSLSSPTKLDFIQPKNHWKWSTWTLKIYTFALIVWKAFAFDWGSNYGIVNLAVISIVVSSLLDFHSSLAGDKRTTEVRGYQVLYFAALSSK